MITQIQINPLTTYANIFYINTSSWLNAGRKSQSNLIILTFPMLLLEKQGLHLFIMFNFQPLKVLHKLICDSEYYVLETKDNQFGKGMYSILHQQEGFRVKGMVTFNKTILFQDINHSTSVIIEICVQSQNKKNLCFYRLILKISIHEQLGFMGFTHLLCGWHCKFIPLPWIQNVQSQFNRIWSLAGDH